MSVEKAGCAMTPARHKGQNLKGPTPAEIAAWIVRQWKRRGLVASADEARVWFERQDERVVATILKRMASGWLAPRG